MPRRHIIAGAIVVLLAMGCRGEATLNYGTDAAKWDVSIDVATGDMGPTNNGIVVDFGPEEDTGPDEACFGVICGANAICAGGDCQCSAGFMGDPDTGCTPGDPCADVNCPYGATCRAGDCSCDPGFDDDGLGGCVAQTPGDTAVRTQMEVCDRWNADYPTQAAQQWQTEPLDQCDWGVLHADFVTDALRRTSLFRWLVGLPAVTSNASHQTVTQACATTLAAENAGLTHQIPNSYACYTAEAAQGAGSSNIALGVRNPADSVDLYVGDNGVPSLGHRRWVFNPPMGATGFGQRDRYSCMYSFDNSGSANPEYVAYPAPGFFPRAAVLGQWSFSSRQWAFDAITTVEVVNAADQTPLTVQNVNVPGGGFGQPILAWTVQGAVSGVEYEVRLANLSGAGNELSYRVTLVDCN